MSTVSIYDLSQRQQIEDEAKKRTQQKLPRALQNGSAYDLNHIKAVTVHSEGQRQGKSSHEGRSPYDCSIKYQLKASP